MYENKREKKTVNAKKNQVGEVFWQKSYTYNEGRQSTNLGIKFKNGDVVFTGLRNVSHIETKKQIKEKVFR